MVLLWSLWIIYSKREILLGALSPCTAGFTIAAYTVEHESLHDYCREIIINLTVSRVVISVFDLRMHFDLILMNI